MRDARRNQPVTYCIGAWITGRKISEVRITDAVDWTTDSRQYIMEMKCEKMIFAMSHIQCPASGVTGTNVTLLIPNYVREKERSFSS